MKNENTMASAVIGWKTDDLNFFQTRKFLTRNPGRFNITGNGMLYYVSDSDLGTDP